MVKPIKILIVDDSALMRKMISDLLSTDSALSVINTAKEGKEALQKIKELKPDVVTLDLEMPGWDGLFTLSKVMKEVPLPVVMLSAHTRAGAAATVKALELGAVDFVSKPSGPISVDIEKIKDELIAKVKVAATVNPLNLRTSEKRSSAQIVSSPKGRGLSDFSKASPDRVVAIGASTGGTRALSQILPQLPKDLPAGILVVQHMPPGFTRSLAERLDKQSAIHIKEAEEGDLVEKGKALIAPGNFHMKVVSEEGEERVVLSQDPPRLGVRPSVDVMMNSVAEVCHERVIGVILTGMGHDGMEGVKKIKGKGGITIAEDSSTCVVFGMPKAAISTGCIDKIVPLPEIAQEIVKTC
ncbi:MAG: chemotaxis response regulator protein-glutamate methylesterase [Candidatus Edwardsbacteria bacterium]